MLPSIAVSTFCPPAGTALMGISAGGNAYHGEMVAGHSLAESIVYGSFSGASEALLERYIGGLPGVSNVEAKGFKGLLQAAHMEGREEVIQTLFDKLFLRTTILKEESPKSMDEWIDFAKDIGKSYVYGAITAGILQSPGAAIRAYNNSSNTSSKHLSISMLFLSTLLMTTIGLM